MVVYLKISNMGSLAFDFKLSLNIVEEITSFNVYGDKLMLSDHIRMGAVNDQSTAFDDRTDAVGALDASTVTPIKEGYESDAFDENYDANANVTAPPVPVEPMTIDLSVYDVFSAGYPATDINDLELNVYSFIAEQYQDAYPVDTYKDWTCDFFVSADAPLNDGLILAGNYGDWGWLGFWVPQNNPGETYEDIGLLGTVSYGGVSNWSYEGICNEVQIFRCGLIDYNGLNTGVKVTVDLRMTSPDGSRTITVRSITVTLGQE